MVDAPDAALHARLELPAVTEMQVVAFAHEISAFDSVEAYEAAPPEEGLKLASQSFIPSGLLSPEGGASASPEATAIFAGRVAEAETRTNALTGRPFRWLLIDTLGGRFDVVADVELLESLPPPGGVISGTFWLSGRLAEGRAQKRSWLGRLWGQARAVHRR